MFDYQENRRFFAQTPGGTEDLGAEELTELEARQVSRGYRGVYFEADQPTLYRIVYTSRHLTRVLAPIQSFRCDDVGYLYRRARAIPWSAFLSPDQTFAVFANVANSRIQHSQYAALRVKDAIADYFMDLHHRRPSVDRVDPDAWINLHVEKNRATINFDASGGSLHRRGYRSETTEAPMQETIAAAMIRLASWDGAVPLVDPMCGSGTLLSEALMVRCRIPCAFLRRRFGFEGLPDFDAALWDSVRKKADGGILELPEGLISGSDLSRKAVDAARANIRRLPFGDRVHLRVKDFRTIDDLGGRVILCNPPYGIRLGRERDLTRLYRDLGDFLKRKCKGAVAYVYVGNRKLLGSIGLKPSWKRPLSSGGLDGRLAKFEIY